MNTNIPELTSIFGRTTTVSITATDGSKWKVYLTPEKRLTYPDGTIINYYVAEGYNEAQDIYRRIPGYHTENSAVNYLLTLLEKESK